ncbi:MAG: hypothetical protein MJZ18_01645 [Bacteroidales bacterium]|nr:hypothetical protein [Bacteroidales bacterium]
MLIVLAVLSGSVFAQSWTQAEINSANTAADVAVLTKEEKDVILYMNLARMYPQKFARVEVEPYDGGAMYGHYLVGSSYKASLLVELNRLTPLDPLYFDMSMYEYAKCWAMESGQLGITGHDRITCNKGNFAECCDYGATQDGRIAVLSLLIDHDVPSLGHRKCILNRDLGKAGPSIQPHKKYGYCCVIDYTFKDEPKTNYNTSYTGSSVSSVNKTSSSYSHSNTSATSTKTVYGGTIRDSFYSHAGKSHLSFLSVGYAYSPKNELKMLSASLLDFRARMFGASLLNFEVGIDPWTEWYCYKPSMKVYFPVCSWMAVVLSGGVSMDCSALLERMNQSVEEELVDVFMVANGGVSLYFVPSRYVPIELKAEYGQDIACQSSVNGLTVGICLHLGR